MGINKPKHSSNKTHKFLRNTAIIASLLTVMNTTQSCVDKNKGMPVRANDIELTSKESTETTKEYISIDNNKVSFNYTFDIDSKSEWNQKDIKYTLEVNKSEDGKIEALLSGSTYYGAESDRDGNENIFKQGFAYTSLNDFNTRSGDEISRYINSVMDNLQSQNKTYITTADDYENVNINQDAQNEVSKKTAKLAGYLKYKMNTHESTVRKEGDVVLLPIRRNDHKFDFKIQANKSGDMLPLEMGEKSIAYDITLNGKTEKVNLSVDPMKFAEKLTKYVEKSLKV